MNKTEIQVITNHPVDILKIKYSAHNFPMHIHRKICVGKIDSGSKLLFFNDRKIKLNKDNFFVIPANEPHSCEVDKRGFVSYTILCFDSIKQLSDIIHMKEFTNTIQNEKLERLIEFALNVDVENIFCDHHLVSMVIKHIDNCFMEPLPIRALSKLININQYHLLHLFKNNTGLSLHQYIIQTRIKKARERASRQCDSLDLGLSCGFYDQSHFIRCFKKHVGVTPKIYINSLNVHDN